MDCVSTTTGTAAQGLRFLGVVRKKRWGRFGGRGFFSKASSNQTPSSLLVGGFRLTLGYPLFYVGTRRHPAERRLHRLIEETGLYGPLIEGPVDGDQGNSTILGREQAPTTKPDSGVREEDGAV
jgi:hypothetical protein